MSLNQSSIINPDWAEWSESIRYMPLIHWYCYSFLECIFNCFVDFATNFGNGNTMSKVCSITDFNTKRLVSAIMSFKAFCTQIQSDDSHYHHAQFRLHPQLLEQHPRGVHPKQKMQLPMLALLPNIVETSTIPLFPTLWMITILLVVRRPKK